MGDIKMATRMMIKNYYVEDSMVNAISYMPSSSYDPAMRYSKETVEALYQVIEYFPEKLNVGQVKKEQEIFVIEALEQCRRSIDGFLGLLPPDAVKEAYAFVEEENRLNLEDYKKAELGNYLNSPT